MLWLNHAQKNKRLTCNHNLQLICQLIRGKLNETIMIWAGKIKVRASRLIPAGCVCTCVHMQKVAISTLQDSPIDELTDPRDTDHQYECFARLACAPAQLYSQAGD